MQRISFRTLMLIGLGVAAIIGFGSQQDIPGKLTAVDMRHVETSEAATWIPQGTDYVDGGVLPRFSTLRVLRISADPKFVVAETDDGRAITVAASALAAGDGVQAKARWCEQQTRSQRPRNEIMERLASGPNQVTIKNLGDYDAVVKFRGVNGTVALSIFVAANSNAVVSDFPDGRFRLQFATGREWSRRSQTFSCDMAPPQQFPDIDQFASTRTQYKVAEYTITRVHDGNVHTKSLDVSAFAAN